MRNDLCLPEMTKKRRPESTERKISVIESRDIVQSYLESGIAPEAFEEALKTLLDNDGKSLVIRGWVARDEDDTLWFHHVKPRKINTKEAYYNCWVWYSDSNSRQIESPKVLTLFQYLRWDNEPVEIELVIKEVGSARTASSTGNK